MKNKEKNFVSAVIYVHNDADVISDFVTGIVEFFEMHFEKSEIICVNDSSKDNSVRKIREVGKQCNLTNISILNMSSFHGLETSMIAGVDLSIGDFVFEFDKVVEDFSMDEVMKIYYKVLEGFDIVSASPDTPVQRSSAVFYNLFNKYANSGETIISDTFRVLSRRVINRISNNSKTIPYRKALYANCGLKVFHMKYDPLDNKKRRKNLEEKTYRKNLAIDALIIFTNLGFTVSLMMTTIMLFVALFMMAYSVFIYVTKNPVAGWTTTILFLSLGFFMLFAILTVIIKYLQVVIDLIFKRKSYNVESIEKITKARWIMYENESS